MNIYDYDPTPDYAPLGRKYLTSLGIPHEDLTDQQVMEVIKDLPC